MPENIELTEEAINARHRERVKKAIAEHGVEPMWLPADVLADLHETTRREWVAFVDKRDGRRRRDPSALEGKVPRRSTSVQDDDDDAGEPDLQEMENQEVLGDVVEEINRRAQAS